MAGTHDDEVDEGEAIYHIGSRVLEMCDRLKVAHKCAPGVHANWVVKVDGVCFTVNVTMGKDGS